MRPTPEIVLALIVDIERHPLLGVVDMRLEDAIAEIKTIEADREREFVKMLRYSTSNINPREKPYGKKYTRANKRSRR